MSSSCDHLSSLRSACRQQAAHPAGPERAAVAIVAAEGIDALTADRIAAEAGVSRRTLFNYFARVEDVLTASIEKVTDDTVAAFVARPSDEPLRRVGRRRARRPARRPGLRPGVRAGACGRLLAGHPAVPAGVLRLPDRRLRGGACATASEPTPTRSTSPPWLRPRGAILTRMTRLVVAETPDADPNDAVGHADVTTTRSVEPSTCSSPASTKPRPPRTPTPPHQGRLTWPPSSTASACGAARRPLAVVIAWVLILGSVAAAMVSFQRPLTNEFELPDSEFAAGARRPG